MSASEQGRLLNPAAAVLGMVALGARSGYEIRRASDRSLRFFWALSPPQIYSELQRLEKAGLLAGADEARGRRPRRTFEITEAGRAALREWAGGPDPGPIEIRDPALLRLFFADALTDAGLAALVEAMRLRSVAALELLESDILPAARRTAGEGFTGPERVAGFGAGLHEFIAGWCERLGAELKNARG